MLFTIFQLIDLVLRPVTLLFGSLSLLSKCCFQTQAGSYFQKSSDKPTVRNLPNTQQHTDEVSD